MCGRFNLDANFRSAYSDSSNCVQSLFRVPEKFSPAMCAGATASFGPMRFPARSPGPCAAGAQAWKSECPQESLILHAVAAADSRWACLRAEERRASTAAGAAPGRSTSPSWDWRRRGTLQRAGGGGGRVRVRPSASGPASPSPRGGVDRFFCAVVPSRVLGHADGRGPYDRSSRSQIYLVPPNCG